MSAVQTQDRQAFLPDWRALSLGVPAALYTIGLMLYCGEGVFPGELTQSGARLWGSWLMVAGAEGGTLSAIVEVGRKIPIKRVIWWLDPVGIAVSVVASIFAVMLVWSRETAVVTPWVLWFRQFGPLWMLAASVADFYSGAGLELGLYLAFKPSDARAARLQALRDELGEETARIEIERQRALLRDQNETGAQLLRAQVAELRASLQDLNNENETLEARLRNQAQPNETDAQPAQPESETRATETKQRETSGETRETKAQLVAQLLKQNGRSVAEIAQLAGCSAQYVRRVRGSL